MSADREVTVEADLDKNTATAVITEIREISNFFDDSGELRLWEDSAGWNGYLHEESDDEICYHHVNTQHDKEHWI